VRGALRAIPFLLDYHNVNSRWHAAHGETRQASRWRRREQEALGAAAVSTACSAEEARALGGGVEVSGHGVAPDEWPESALALDREPAAALFGSWDHRPNAEAGRWLAEEVWPAVLAAVPDARLVLAGPGAPPPELLALAGVDHVGRADSLAGLLGRVRLALVPIRDGIGARVKFGEALASGAAVVSTTEGAEGFEADGAYVQADGAAEFARACAELLRDETRARELGAAGRRLALARLTWKRTTEPLVRFAEGP
jgi:glycosyltransferase involved in cell wall biosynthesis